MLSGPGVCGETKAALFQPSTERFHRKTEILDRYMAMNIELAKEAGVPYINVRKAFLQAIPW